MKFEVLVIGPEVDRQLAPYGKEARASPYRHYLTEPEIAEVRDWAILMGELPADCDEAQAAEYVVQRLYGDLMSERDKVERDERGWRFFTTENPTARWDYWFIDSRWWPLRTKPGGSVVTDEAAEIGWPDVLDRPNSWWRAAPGEVLHGAQSLVGEIDFAAMEREAADSAGNAWDEHQEAVRAGRADSLAVQQIAGFTREEYILRCGWHPAFLVEGGRWHERGDLGLRASVGDDRALEWRRFVDDLIGRLSPDTLVTKVVCHT
ncbi:hypothetical protein [Streptosporangium sp. KLBMP 9127]|nr:hypothetical protein [Streptosporangium sp. KLBMP 9127]